MKECNADGNSLTNCIHEHLKKNLTCSIEDIGAKKCTCPKEIFKTLLALNQLRVRVFLMTTVYAPFEGF